MTPQGPQPIRADERLRQSDIRYSICTIVTRPSEYEGMIASFRHHGFQEPASEFLYLDNSKGNSFDAYAGYNLFLNVARGAYVILCHQDIELIDDGRTKLDTLIDDLTKQDPNWAACGNAGAEYPGQLALRISDPHGNNQCIGNFPAKVQALDENFIVVRQLANLAVSRDLEGFHFYAADICTIADILGWNCYVIDFHLRHKSAGSKDKSFFDIRSRLIQKYSRALHPRWMATTNTVVFLSGSRLLGRLLNTQMVSRLVRFLGCKIPSLFKK